MRFLTNMDLADLDFARQAASKTGFDIVVRDTPLTLAEAWEECDFDDLYTPPWGYGSVWTSQPDRDHSPFWHEFDALRDGAKS